MAETNNFEANFVDLQERVLYVTEVLLVVFKNLVYLASAAYLFCYVRACLSVTRWIFCVNHNLNSLHNWTSTQKPKIIGKAGLFKKTVEKFPSFKRGYRPTIWCFPSIPNTLVQTLFQKAIPQNYEKYALSSFYGHESEFLKINRCFQGSFKNQRRWTDRVGLGESPNCHDTNHSAHSAWHDDFVEAELCDTLRWGCEEAQLHRRCQQPPWNTLWLTYSAPLLWVELWRFGLGS
jgi:hypothetical protein